MRTILIATRNKHKVEEIRGILGPKLAYGTLDDWPRAPAVVEDAPDFAGNAIKKAVALANWLTALPGSEKPDFVLADDSGLEVDALNGAPGVHSARFAAIAAGTAVNSPDLENNARLLHLLRDVPPERRTARFRCVIAITPVPEAAAQTSSPVCDANEAELTCQVFEGVCEGRMLDAPRGSHGFGYDPLFVPNGFSETFAELGEETKNKISHRSRALHRLKEKMAQQL